LALIVCEAKPNGQNSFAIPNAAAKIHSFFPKGNCISSKRAADPRVSKASVCWNYKAVAPLAVILLADVATIRSMVRARSDRKQTSKDYSRG
jgi:hypothetical protein